MTWPVSLPKYAHVVKLINRPVSTMPTQSHKYICFLQIILNNGPSYFSTHAHKHPFNSPFSGTIWVSRYQKGKTTEARDSEWQYGYIAKFAGHLPHRYGNSRAIWGHTVLPATCHHTPCIFHPIIIFFLQHMPTPWLKMTIL